MRQAIETKYFGPTNHRGARVKASAQAGSVTIPWDDALDVVANHAAAARALIRKYDWQEHGKWFGGANVDGTGYTFVNAVEYAELEM